MHLVYTNRTAEYQEGYNQALSDVRKEFRKVSDDDLE